MVKDSNNSDDPLDITPEEKKEVDKIIRQSQKLNPKPKRFEKSKRAKKKEYEIVSRFLSEYLDSYIIIGFTTSAEDFAVMKYNNPMERRALTHLVDEFFAVHFDALSDNPDHNIDDEEDDDDE